MIRRSKGFTLVEIMIVVAIIGILIAIAVPGFLKARETSRKNSCQENQTKIDGGLQQYILENNFENQATAVDDGLSGTDSWADDLVGPSSYIRYTPECPSSGTYFVSNADPYDPPVTCTVSTHVYPQSTSS